MSFRLYETPHGQLPSVTAILSLLDKSAALMPWAVNLAVDYCEAHINEPDVFQKARVEFREVSGEACDIGSIVHDMISNYIKGELIEYEWYYNHYSIFDEHARHMIYLSFCAFLDWNNENVETWLETERKVFSSKYGYAGTLDGVPKLKDGRIIVIDFKSSKGFFDGYEMQIAAYREAYTESTGIEVDGQGILRLDKFTGEPEFREKTYTKNHRRNFESFKALLHFYYLQKNRRLKNNAHAIQMKERFRNE